MHFKTSYHYNLWHSNPWCVNIQKPINIFCSCWLQSKRNPSSRVPSKIKICRYFTITPLLTLKKPQVIKIQSWWCNITKWCNQSRNRKIYKKCWWTLEALSLEMRGVLLLWCYFVAPPTIATPPLHLSPLKLAQYKNSRLNLLRHKNKILFITILNL